MKLINYINDLLVDGLKKSILTDLLYSSDLVSQDQCFEQVYNFPRGRNADDLLFQVLRDLGVALTLPMSRAGLAGRVVVSVDGNPLATCFATEVKCI